MNVLIAGATSAIAQASAKQMLVKMEVDIHFILLARDNERATIVADDLRARGALKTSVITADLSQVNQLDSLLTDIQQQHGAIDIALLAHGQLPDHKSIQNSNIEVQKALDLNAISYIQMMTTLARIMEQAETGSIAIISSVAGDRGRQSNYIYGAAKGTVSLFAQGLRNRLSSKGIDVITIKPGFVDTPMTDGFDKSGPLWATTDQVAEDIVNAILKKRSIVYTPWFWAPIMLVIKCIPEFIFKRLSL